MAQPGRTRSLPKDARRIPVPAAALEEWLAEIDDPAELKVALRVAGLLAAEPIRRNVPPSLSLDEVLDDDILRRATRLGSDSAIRQALAAALRRETLVATQVGGEVRLFLNDERCDEYLVKMQLPRLRAPDVAPLPIDETAAIGDQHTVPVTPRLANIFALYERHISTFGYSTAEQLKAAEEEYPMKWFEYAFATASEHGARSWSYVNTILRRLVREGLPEGTIDSHEHGKLGIDSEADSRTELLDQYRRLFGRPPWESENRD